MRSAPLLAALLLSCATPSGPTGQGGAQFRETKVEPPAAPVEAVYSVCWPAEAPVGRVTLVFEGGGAILFEARDGATNSTARCLREIAATWPWAQRPAGTVELAPPGRPPSGWEVLAWVKLLSATRYGPERGVLDPAPLVRGCLSAGGGLREATRFEVTHTPSFAVVVPGGAATDSERCVEAVLGSTAWPSTRAFALAFASDKGAPAAAGDVSFYFAPGGDALPALDPARVSESVRLRQKGVAACWEAALGRRGGLGGGRTFRFRTDDTGGIASAWVAGNASDAPTAADYVLDGCLRAVLRGVRVEGAGAGEGLYTWVFATRG